MIKKGKESPCYIDKAGEVHTTNKGEIIEIVETFEYTNNTVRFLDGTLKTNVAYNNIKRGAVEKPIDRVGETTITNQGYEIRIVEYLNSSNCFVLFLKTKNIKKVTYPEFKAKTVSNPLHKGVHNIGFEGIGAYSFKSDKKRYRVWHSMLQRAYSEEYHRNQPTYKTVTVCEEWHNFQNFAKWYDKNYNAETMEGWQLDKDILVKGNKIYSPETCCFVPLEINTIFKGNQQKGYNRTVRGDFIVRINKGKTRETVGRFDTELESIQAYKHAKEEYIKEIAGKWKDIIDPRVYEVMHNYEIIKQNSLN